MIKTLWDIVQSLEAQKVDVRQDYWDAFYSSKEWVGGLASRKVLVHVAGSSNNRPIEEIHVDKDGDIIIEVPA